MSSQAALRLRSDEKHVLTPLSEKGTLNLVNLLAATNASQSSQEFP